MSRMLSLGFHAWNLARRAATDGRFAVASRHLQRVLIDDTLPASERVEALRLAGSLHLEAGRFAKARNTLREAIRQKPKQANTHYLLGLAHERDSYGSLKKAALRFRKATRLDESNATYWAALARVTVRIGRRKLAKVAIHRAMKLAPTDSELRAGVIDTLLEAGWTKTALRMATQARFLAPRDRDVEALWNRVRFETTRQQQVNANPRGSAKLLPYLRVVAVDGQKHEVRRVIVCEPKASV